jgi:hypothetical protein
MSEEHVKEENVEQEDLDNEIKQLEKINEDFKKEELLGKLKEVEKLGRELAVGQQTSYQNRFFVLNDTEFPTGTSGKSRQAVFEAAVRVDSLKGLVFEYNKTIGEIKQEKANLMRAEEKLNDPEASEADKLEAEGKIDVSKAEIRQKEIGLENMHERSKQLLRSMFDFYEEFEKNEEECKKLGFTCKDWNRLEVEDHYWRTVNDKKVLKSKMYQLAGMSKEQGDSLPLQNRLDVGRVKQLDTAVENEIKRLQEVPKDQENKNVPNNVDEWVVKINDEHVDHKTCPHRDGKGRCMFRKDIPGACTFRYCYSLGMDCYRPQ